jgi:hypothetical protein
MFRNRLTIASLLVVIVFCGFVFAGLRAGSGAWLKLIYTMTFGTLVYAAIAARYRGAYWYGFAIAGWAYFFTGIIPWINLTSQSEPRIIVNAGHLTSAVYEAVIDIHPPEDTIPALPDDEARAAVYRVAICHCALTILLGLAGGLVSGAMAGRQPRNREAAQP